MKLAYIKITRSSAIAFDDSTNLQICEEPSIARAEQTASSLGYGIVQVFTDVIYA